MKSHAKNRITAEVMTLAVATCVIFLTSFGFQTWNKWVGAVASIIGFYVFMCIWLKVIEGIDYWQNARRHVKELKEKEKKERDHRYWLWNAQEVEHEKMPWEVREALVDMMDSRHAREDMIDRVLEIREGVEADMTVRRAAYGLCDNMLRELGYVECLMEAAEGESNE